MHLVGFTYIPYRGDINQDSAVLPLCHYCNDLAGKEGIGRLKPWLCVITIFLSTFSLEGQVYIY